MDWVQVFKNDLEKLTTLLIEIDQLEKQADEIRDRMDGSWYRLSEEQKAEVRRYSAELDKKINFPQVEESP